MADDALPNGDDVVEKWRNIPGHPNYELSNRGRVRSWKHWVGCNQPLPRILTIRNRSGRRTIQLGLDGGSHDVDVLMEDIWGAPAVVRVPVAPRIWRRIMLTERQHVDLVKVLNLINSPLTRRLLVHVRTAKKVQWEDQILPEDVPQEEEP